MHSMPPHALYGDFQLINAFISADGGDGDADGDDEGEQETRASLRLSSVREAALREAEVGCTRQKSSCVLYGDYCRVF